MQPTSQPRFVVFEGLDGAGTTTQSRRLADALIARDLRVRLTAEPTDGPMGRLLRSHVKRDAELDPPTAALVFTADRADHLDSLIRPALRRGEWVVCDRYLLSTLAYQGMGGVDQRSILAASKGFDVPDLTLFLDVPAEVLADRVRARGAAERYEDPALTEKLRASYETAIELLRGEGHTIEVLDGTQPVEDVSRTVETRLDALV